MTAETPGLPQAPSTASAAGRRRTLTCFLAGMVSGIFGMTSVLLSCRTPVNGWLGETACAPAADWVLALLGTGALLPLAIIVRVMAATFDGDELDRTIHRRAWQFAGWVTLAAAGVLGVVDLAFPRLDLPVIALTLVMLGGYGVGLARERRRYD